MQNLDNQTILITGTAGFIGSNLTKEIIHTASNVTVIGLDSVNDYYDVSLKEYRLNEIENLAKEKSGCNWEIYQGKSCGQAAYRYNFQRIYSKDSCKSCCTGGCTLFYNKSRRLHRVKYNRFLQYP